MQYEIIEGYDKKAFQEWVIFYLATGWKCQGGVVVDRSGHSTIYFQALVKP